MMDTSITISSVKRIHGRAVLTLANGDTVVMPRALLREQPYRSGMQFDRDAFDRMLDTHAYSFGLQKAVTLLASRARTEKEIVDALRKNAYPETVIARVMARLNEYGYVDDTAFAGQWAASRTAKGMGTRRIRMELRQKGVDQQEIDAVLSSIDEREILSGAFRTAQKAARGKQLSSPADRQKIIASLARHGYDYSVAKRALQMLIEQE